eukprot:2243833-Rhodomonas_salina.1
MCERTTAVLEPPPKYNADKDDITCVIAPIFGPRNWEIPPKVCTRTRTHTPERYNLWCDVKSLRPERSRRGPVCDPTCAPKTSTSDM